jgi:membrane protease YdiL (CAAX protease family)
MINPAPTPIHPSQADDRNRPALWRKAAALLEVMGIFIVGIFAVGQLAPLVGIKPLGLLFESAFKSKHPDFIALSIGWLQIMLLQYACWLTPAFAIGWWRRRRGLAQYGLTTAGQPVWRLLGMGLVAFALVALPFKLLLVFNQFIPLGPLPPFWALLHQNWTPSFWVLLAVSSFAFTPVLEELFFRGYCQTRLEEDFGGMGAIVIVTLFMTLGHNQYYHLSILSIGTILGLIPMVLGMGFVYWRTRSLIPGIMLHAAVNFPTKGIYDFILPAVMVVVLIIFRKQWLSPVRIFRQEWVKTGWQPAAFIAAIVASLLVVGFETWPRVVLPFAIAGLALALFLLFRERRKERV